MKRNFKATSPLITAVLTSSLIAAVPITAKAALTPILASTNTTSEPDEGLGYLFANVLSDATLTVIDGYSIGTTQLGAPLNLVASVDVSPLVGIAGKTTEVDFAGGATLTGALGPTNAVTTVKFLAGSKTVNFQGNVTANSILFEADAVANLSDTVIVTGVVDNGSGAGGIGTLLFQGGGQVTGNIGSTNAIKLITINSTGAAAKTVELDGTVVNANTINIVGLGSSTTTLLLNSAGTMALTGNITTNNNNVDVLNITNAAGTTINGTIGGVGHNFSLIKVGVNADTTLNGNVFATLTQLQGNHNLILGNNVIVTGGIDSSASGVGSLNFLGNGTVTGDIGDAPLNNVVLQGGVGKVVNFQGDVLANNVIFQGDSTANLSDGSTIFAPVTTTANNQGTLVYLGSTTVSDQVGSGGLALKLLDVHGPSGSTVNLNTNVYATNTNVDNGGTLLVAGTQTINGNLSISNNSTLGITTNTAPLTVTGNFSLGAGTFYNLNMNNLVASGSVNVTGTATVSPTSKVVITNAPGVVPGGTATVTIVTDGTGGGAGLNVIPVVSTSLITHFATQVNGNLLQLVITSTPNALVGGGGGPGNGGGCGAGQVLVNLANAGQLSGSLFDIVDALGDFSDLASFQQACVQLSPIVDGAVVIESFENQQENFDLIEERLAKKHFCKAHPNHMICTRPQSGVASGDFGEPDGGNWIKVFGRSADQDERQGVDGYHDHTWGIGVGGDLMISERALIGAAFHWSHLDVDDHVSNSSTKADSYQETIYGSYEFKSPLFFNWALALAYNDYFVNRNIQFGPVILTPTGHFHGWQSGANAELGYDFMSEVLHTIPTVSLYYSHLDLSGYTERGANTANQQVDSHEFNMLLASVGVKFVYDYCYDRLLYQPDLHLKAFYDFIDDRMELTSQFVGAGPSFETVGFKPARGSFNIGFGLNVFSEIGVSLVVNYDYLTKKDYSANSGSLKLRYDW